MSSRLNYKLSSQRPLVPHVYSSEVPCRVSHVVRDELDTSLWTLLLEYDSTRVVVIDNLCRVNVRAGSPVMEGTLLGYYRD